MGKGIYDFVKITDLKDMLKNQRKLMAIKKLLDLKQKNQENLEIFYIKNLLVK